MSSREMQRNNDYETNEILQDALKAEIQDLQAQIQYKKSEIEQFVDKMEDGKKSRERARKELLLREMKLILGRMKVAEDKVTKELKNEAFDNVRNLGRIHKRLLKLEDLVQSSSSSNASMTEFNAIKVKRLWVSCFT